MQRTNQKIGFKDGWLMVFGILGFAIVVPIIFFGNRFGRPPYFTLPIFLVSLLTVFVIWVGNRYIMVWARNRYPDFGEARKRLRVQGLTMLAFTLLSNNLLSILFRDVCAPNMAGRNQMDVLINCNFASLFCSLTVVAIYESRYFMDELKKSVEEKELLKRETLIAQWNALKTQVNPHFLFNNLNTLTSIIPDSPEQAVTFTQELSRVYRHILDVKDEQSILLREELDVLEAYAFLLKTRFAENLNIQIRVTEEKLNQHIVPLSLQILMENAIKHNIVSSAKPLRIDVFAEDGRLIVKNTLQKKRQLPESTGIGLDNLRNRYRLLDDQRTVEVREEEGSFTVSIPLIANKNGSTDHRR